MSTQIGIFIVVSVTLALCYMLWIRPWQLNWGAAVDDISRSMPGDEIVDRPSFDATRAVTIQAPLGAIYPWIVQMGLNRAGWYSYDILDNLGRRSAEAILPEYQVVQPGDLIPMSPDGKQGIWVSNFKENEWMLWWDKIGDMTWAWELHPQDDSSTRLVSRVRVKYRWFSPEIIFNLLIEFTDIVMMRKCMLGIKKRAESLRSTVIPVAAQEGSSNQ